MPNPAYCLVKDLPDDLGFYPIKRNLLNKTKKTIKQQIMDRKLLIIKSIIWDHYKNNKQLYPKKVDRNVIVTTLMDDDSFSDKNICFDEYELHMKNQIHDVCLLIFGIT